MIYRDLDSKPNILPGCLHFIVLKPDMFVVILVGKIFSVMVRTLAILNSVQYFVPIDPGLPNYKFKYSLYDVILSVIFTSSW